MRYLQGLRFVSILFIDSSDCAFVHRHLFSLHFGDVRIRAERNLAQKQSSIVEDGEKHKGEHSKDELPKLWKLVQWMAKV